MLKENNWSKKPDLSKLKAIANAVNSVPLPKIPESMHILLPQPENALIRNNFQVFSEEIFFNLNNNCNKKEDINKTQLIGVKRKDPEDKKNISLTKKRNRNSIGLNANFKHNSRIKSDSNIKNNSNLRLLDSENLDLNDNNE